MRLTFSGRAKHEEFLLLSVVGSNILSQEGGILQGDTSPWFEPPVDNKSKVPYWPDLPWPGQAKTELLSWCQQEVWINEMCHPVKSFTLRPLFNHPFIQIVFAWQLIRNPSVDPSQVYQWIFIEGSSISTSIDLLTEQRIFRKAPPLAWAYSKTKDYLEGHMCVLSAVAEQPVAVGGKLA